MFPRIASGLHLAMGVTFALAVSTAVASCSFGPADECNAGDDHCEGTAIMRCDTCHEIGCSWRWTLPTDCALSGAVCVNAHNSLFCAVSATPDPRCGTVAGYCDGDQIVECWSGYRSGVVDCAASGSACTESGKVPQCVKSPDPPDPRCSGAAQGFCSGSTRFACRGGSATAAEQCEHACVEGVLGVATCVLSDVPDPGCAPDAGVYTGAYCRGTSKVTCSYGYAVEVKPCASCVRAGLFADCTGPDGG